MSERETEDFEGSLIKETDHAIFANLQGHGPIWIPRSVIPYLKKDTLIKPIQINLQIESWWVEKHL